MSETARNIERKSGGGREEERGRERGRAWEGERKSVGGREEEWGRER